MGLFVIAYFIYQKTKLAETLKTNTFKEFKLKQPLPQKRLAGKSYMRLKDRRFPITMAALVKLEEEKNKQQPPRTNKEMTDVQDAKAYAKLKSSLERTNLPYSAIMTQGDPKALGVVKSLDEVKAPDGAAVVIKLSTDLTYP